ncbi:MAG: TetR/AcrR family transcriptional regulator [Micromonosporaceae bacterium]
MPGEGGGAAGGRPPGGGLPGGSRAERADAARNRRAILAATEQLLATHRPQDISMEQVAAAAGVGKGTVFHRFGNRMGLMTALMVERARALEDAVTAGPPPLGEGAPDRERLLAFLAAIIEVISRNKSLLAELAHSAGLPAPAAGQESPDGQDKHPVYSFWHRHISGLIAAQRPGADATLIAHILLGSLHSEPILSELTAGGPGRLTAAMQALACAVLDAPAEGSRPG